MRDAVPARQFVLRDADRIADRADIINTELGSPMRFTAWPCPVRIHIGPVLPSGTPRQVRQDIVVAVVVKVATFHPIRALTNERLQHEYMEQNVTTGAICSAERHLHVVAVRAIDGQQTWGSALPWNRKQRTNPAKVADFVATFKPAYWHPAFVSRQRRYGPRMCACPV